MKAIFTYPNNSGTNFIDPNYLGDDTVGYQKRVKEMKDGTYLTHLNPYTASYGTTLSTLIKRQSKYNNALEESWGQNTIYKFWELPIVDSELELIESDISSGVYGNLVGLNADAEFNFSGNHGFYTGQKMLASGFDGSGTNLNGNEYYVGKEDSNTIKLYIDSARTLPVKFYNKENGTVSSATAANPCVFNLTGHEFTDGRLVEISNFDGTIGDEYNDEQFYVQVINADSFNLSFDAAGTDLLRYGVIQDVDIIEYTLQDASNNPQVNLKLDTTDTIYDQSKIVYNDDTISRQATSFSGTSVGEDWRGTAILDRTGKKLYELTVTGQTNVTVNIKKYSARNDTYELDYTHTISTTYDNDDVNDRPLSISRTASDTRIAFALPSDAYVFEDTGTGFTEIYHNTTGGIVAVLSQDGTRVCIPGAGTFGNPLIRHMDTNQSYEISRAQSTLVGNSSRNRIGWDNSNNLVVMWYNTSTTSSSIHLYEFTGSAYDNSGNRSLPDNNLPLITVDNGSILKVVNDDMVLLDEDCENFQLFNIQPNELQPFVSVSNKISTGLTSTFAHRNAISLLPNNDVVVGYGAGNYTIKYFEEDSFSYTLKQSLDLTDEFTDVFAGSNEKGFILTYDLDGSSNIYSNLDINVIRFVDIDYIVKRFSDSAGYYLKANASLPGYFTVFTDVACTQQYDYSSLEIDVDQTATHSDFMATAEMDVNPDVVDSTTGDLEEVYTPPTANIYANNELSNSTTGTLTIATSETNRYRLSDIEVMWPGNKAYLQRTGASTYVGNARIKEGTYWLGGSESAGSSYGHWPDISISEDNDGYLTGTISFDTEFPGSFPSEPDRLFEIETVPNTYTPPSTSLVEQQDVWDTQDEWNSAGYDSQKTWPYHVSPANAVLRYDMPSSVTKSQGGTKYVRGSGFTRWQLEVTYPPMTKNDFAEFHTTAQLAQGQVIPFHFILRNSAGDNILFDYHNNSSESTVRLKDPISAGDKTVLLEGFPSFLTDAVKQGELMIIDSDNGRVNTVAGDVQSNAYGEVLARFPYAQNSNKSRAELTFLDPFSVVVTLADNGFEYSVDTAGFYNLTVKFDLDEWK